MQDYKFGNFLYTLRDEKGLTQSELGKMLGVTNKAVSKWENGSAKPNTSLIPKLAEIFEITVEELFTCKRIDKDSESEKIKIYLSNHKKHQAKLSSIYLSLIVIIPLLIFEFVGIVMGFNLPDDVLGPLGSVTFIILFIISLSCFITHKKAYKRAFAPSELSICDKDIKVLKYATYISAVSFYSLLILFIPIYLVAVSFSKALTSANIFLCIMISLLIIILGIMIFCFNFKKLLKIKFSLSNNNSENISKKKNNIKNPDRISHTVIPLGNSSINFRNTIWQNAYFRLFGIIYMAWQLGLCYRIRIKKKNDTVKFHRVIFHFKNLENLCLSLNI